MEKGVCQRRDYKESMTMKKQARPRVKELFDFIHERHSIYGRRSRGLPKPWTKDKILQSYRFCNVYRELDTQTLWFRKHWRMPNADDPDLWFAALVFRFVNWNETAEELGYPVPWDPQQFTQTLWDRKKNGKKCYSAAYMISTHGVKEEKATYLAGSLDKIWRNRRKIRYVLGEGLADFHKRLMNCFDVGSFIAAQVIADAKYVGDMIHAPDWFTFAASGPGSRRGLARMCDLRTDLNWNEEAWRETLAKLKVEIDPLIAKAGMDRLHAQDLQNCLCEFDKYERVRLGEGRPKQKYNGGKE